MPYKKPLLLIGVSARIYYPQGPVLDLGGVWTKTLHYLEQSVALWLLHGGALPVLIPAFEGQSLVQPNDLNLQNYVNALDGLVLQGGNDVCPETYGESPLREEWAGDRVRDRYEIELIRAFMDAGKPVFGICRGVQILNVAFGGTLYQDLPTQCGLRTRHLAEGAYENNFHTVEIEPSGWLGQIYPTSHPMRVNSIHHQAIKNLAPHLRVEARSPDDGIIEAVSLPGRTFVAGVQWHPEFHPMGEPGIFDDRPMLRSFLAACRQAAVAGGL